MYFQDLLFYSSPHQAYNSNPTLLSFQQGENDNGNRQKEDKTKEQQGLHIPFLGALKTSWINTKVAKKERTTLKIL